MIKRRY